MEARFDGAHRDIERLADIGQAHPGVVMQDEDGALLGRQAPEGPFQLVAVLDGQQLVGRGWMSGVRSRMLAFQRRLLRAHVAAAFTRMR